MAGAGRLKDLKAIIFDMDGTLTEPHIDWKVLRARIACPPDKTIIEHIESLPPDRAAQANAVLLETERDAAERAAVNAGAIELVEALRNRGLKLALVTNNHGAAMRLVLQRYGLSFDVALSRDDGPIKPEPHLICKALDTLQVSAAEALGIGDSRYDILACKAAGVRCIYLTHGAAAIDHEPAVASLLDVLPLLDAP